MIKSATRQLLKALYGLKQAWFPNFCVERWVPGWHRLHTLLAKRAAGTYVEGVWGHKMHLDANDSLQLSINQVFEPEETEFLRRTVKTGDVILDIGANIGYYTLLFAKAVGPSGHVYAFEPAPANVDILRKNVDLNGYRNVTVVPMAVSDVSGVLRLFCSEEHQADHRIYDSGEQRKVVEIPATTIDDFLKDRDQRVSLVKMDVQGAEFKVLAGMPKLLLNNPRVTVVTEFWPYGLAKAGSSAELFLDRLRAHGFQLFSFANARGDLEPVKPHKIAGLSPGRSEDYTNLVCLRRDVA